MDEVLKAVAGVNWRILGKLLIREEIEPQMIRYTNLDRIRDTYKSDEARLRAVVEKSLPKLGGSWRPVIWALYCVGEIDKAQQVSSYAGPMQGSYVLCIILIPFIRPQQFNILFLIQCNIKNQRGRAALFTNTAEKTQHVIHKDTELTLFNSAL